MHNTVSNEETIGLSMNECKMLMHEKVLFRWQIKWNESEKGHVTYEFIKDVSFSVRNQEFKPSMHLGFLLTGHGSLNEFLFKRGLSESARCSCGAEYESWKHVLVECRLFADIRELTVCGISVDSNGTFEFGNLLSTRESYEAINRFSARVFERRKLFAVHIMVPLGGWVMGSVR